MSAPEAVTIQFRTDAPAAHIVDGCDECGGYAHWQITTDYTTYRRTTGACGERHALQIIAARMAEILDVDQDDPR